MCSRLGAQRGHAPPGPLDDPKKGAEKQAPPFASSQEGAGALYAGVGGGPGYGGAGGSVCLAGRRERSQRVSEGDTRRKSPPCTSSSEVREGGALGRQTPLGPRGRAGEGATCCFLGSS